jgi:hypothetical protein
MYMFPEETCIIKEIRTIFALITFYVTNDATILERVAQRTINNT